MDEWKQAVLNVIEKRMKRGSTKEQINNWLELLKKGFQKNTYRVKVLDEMIKIRASNLSISGLSGLQNSQKEIENDVVSLKQGSATVWLTPD